MRRILFYAVTAAFAGLFFASCAPAEKEFNKEFLYSGSGEWVSTQDFGDGNEEIHDKFNADGTGSTWSVTQDTYPQPFDWELVGRRLTFIHIMETRAGGVIPKDYTVTTLTETSLVYKDEWGNTISCTKR